VLERHHFLPVGFVEVVNKDSPKAANALPTASLSLRYDTHTRERYCGPYYACTGVRPIMMLGIGGLRINASARVLDPYDEPIPGLYAAGEVAGGAMGTTYLAGCNVGLACTFGYIAGQNAAAED